MPKPNAGKHRPAAVVSGATKGLGRAIAEIFAANGFDLFVCARTAADLEAMQAAWAMSFPEQSLFATVADLSKKEDVLRFADAVHSRCTRLNVLVNNVGLFAPGTLIGEADGVLEQMIAANLYSAYHLTRALLPTMLPHRQGHIFNMCSTASLVVRPDSGAYSIAKFALEGFSKSLRAAMKKEGIKVTGLYPGSTWTASWEGADLPAERLMQASDIAKMVWAAYQLSDSAVVEELVLRPQLGDL